MLEFAVFIIDLENAFFIQLEKVPIWTQKADTIMSGGLNNFLM